MIKVGELVQQVDARLRVSDVAISPEGKMLVAGTEGGKLHLWNLVNEKREIKRLNGHSGNISSIKFSRDGQWLASAGLDDKKILLWKVKNWTIARELKEHTETIFSIAFSPDSKYLVSGGYDNRLIVWEVATGKVVKTFSEHTRGISGVAFSPDGKWFASASWDNLVRVWDWQQKETQDAPLHKLEHKDSVFFIDFSPDSQWLASGGDDRIVRLWEVQQGKEIKRFTKHKSWISSVMFSADGQWLISCAADGRIEIQDLPNHQSTELKLNELISRMSVHPQEKQFIGVSMVNGSIRLHDIQSTKLLSLLVIGTKESDWLSCDFTTPDCLRSRPWIDWFLQFAIVWIVLAFVMTIIVWYYYRVYHHPLIVSLTINPHLLLDLPLTQLPGTKRLLRLSGRFKFVLGGCHLLPVDLENAINFIKSPPATQAKILAEKLEATLEPQTPGLFILRLSGNFPINLKDCFLYFPSANTPTSTILNKLNWDDKFISQKVIIVTLNTLQQKVLRPHGEDLTSLFIVPNLIELTRWLLAPQPIMECARTIANQLKVIQLSPYQIAGGIDRESNFFGREQILTHIFNRHQANYLIVGGRQIGKTSLLKHLLRYYRKQPNLQCHFLSLSNHELLGKLASSLQLPPHSRIDEIECYLIRSGQYHLFLIDETDRFIQAEMQRGYTVLKHFRGLSEEEHCCFFFAGFWQLYQSAVLDYHSPLKNFAETITIAELEPEACHDLIVKPLYSLNIKMASEELIEKIIYLTGQRANLIALVCHEMLKNLDLTTRVLHEADVMRALESKAVNESIEGWKNLTADEELNRLDRLIVYSTIQKEKFTLTSLLETLASYGSYPLPQVEHSLARLTLSFVIQRQQHHYTYCVPLLRKQLLQEDLDELIKWELK